jgi:5-methylcytosine-specific restriction endonuclease McrA
MKNTTTDNTVYIPYAEKLKSPAWQEKRLAILNRDKFTCFYCDDKNSTLHVHHLKYEQGRDPWDYPDTNLVTLCETCHSLEHLSQRTELEVLLIKSCIEFYRVATEDKRAAFRKSITNFSKLHSK